MPLFAMPSRYRPVSGKARYISPVALTPPDPNTPAAFDPKMAEADTNQSPSPLPPEQESMPRSVGPSDTKARGELLQPQMIDADAGKKLKMSGWNHLKMMPPPGMNHHAAGDVITEPEVGVVGEDGPEVIEPVAGAPDDNSPSVNTDTTPLPPLDSEKKPEKSDRGLKALPESNPGAPPEEPLPQPPPELSQVGGPQAIPTPQAPPAPAPNSLAPKPPSSAQQASAAANAALAKQHEEKPGPAPNNWAQRLALAVLSTTRLAPIANQLIHPKWTEQERAYESKLGDLQEQQKEAGTAAGTEALIEQREAQAQFRQAEAARQAQIQNKDPHAGMQQIDPTYAQQNLNWLMPDANGQYWVDKTIANTFAKPDKDKAPVLHVVDGKLVNDQGNIVYDGAGKTPKSEAEWIGIANDPKSPPELVAQARKNLADFSKQHVQDRPQRQETAMDQKRALGSAINDEFQKAHGDWGAVLQNMRNGTTAHPEFMADIADHAEKMAKLPPDAQRKVAAADTTVDQVNRAIDAINEIRNSHPELIGPWPEHPLNTLTRNFENWTGNEPRDVGAADSILETAAALQPGQHNFRSIGALGEFKKALGIDPRSGKANGSREWLKNPDKAIKALQEVSHFNERLKDNTLGAAGQHSATHGSAAKTYSQADVDAAVKAHTGMTAQQIEDGFAAKGWVKK